jgi:hypothetical protein
MRALAILALLAQSPLVVAQQDTLVARMNHFASTYRQFAEQHNRGVFDVALAKKLSQEWREVEASGEWPKAAANRERSAATTDRRRGGDSR